jgi:hypothetical protein
MGREGPIQFTAVIVNSYVVPGERPVTAIGDSVPVNEISPGWMLTV